MFPGEVLEEKREETDPIGRDGTNMTRNYEGFSLSEESLTTVIGVLLHHTDEPLHPSQGLLHPPPD